MASGRLCKNERGRKKLVTILNNIQSRDNQFCRSINEQLFTEEDTLLWLSRRDLKGKTESEIIEAQNQALQIRCHAIKILRKTGSKRRLCQECDEKIGHIISACPLLAKEQYTVYIKRRDRVCAQIHTRQESKKVR